MDAIFSSLGTMMVVATATAMTGGVVAMPGEQIVTGSSHASVEIHTTIQAGGGGGESVTTIKTQQGDEIKEEVKTEIFAPGEPIQIHAGAEVRSGKNKIASSSYVASSSAATSSAGEQHLPTSLIKGFSSFVVVSISEFFGSLFSFWNF